MKKLIALILTIALLMPAAAWACESAAPPLPVGSGNLTLTGVSWWTVTEEHMLASIKDEGEALIRLSIQSVAGQYVRGRMDNGWCRDLRDGQGVAVRVMACGDTVIGLTKLENVSITIYEEYKGLAGAVVESLLGGGAELTNANAAACATWLDGDWASTIFFPSYSDRFVIGTVAFNGGQDVTPFCAGTFGGCLRFGLMCGFREPEPVREWIDVNVTAEAAANAAAVAAAQVSAQASAGAAVSASGSATVDQSGNGCYRNNTVIQVNVGVWQAVKNCVKLLKECAE